jgi:CNT family concentrative nucleoside transporter
MIQSLIGLLALPFLAWLLSEARHRFDWRIVAAGLAMQIALALVFLHLSWMQQAFLGLNRLVLALDQATGVGTRFVFGYLGGGDAPFTVSDSSASFILAFRALPMVLVVSALSALLFHWRILPLIVRGFAWLLRRTLGVGGALGLGAAANIFVGMVESPLLIRPYLARMTRSELFALMTLGMATIAGTVLALYAAILTPILADALGHLLAASILSAPAAIVIARIMVPETAVATDAELDPGAPDAAQGAMDAVTRGTLDGLRLLAHIIALLIVLVALVSLANQLLGALPEVAGTPLTLQRMLGWLMAPLAWLIGIPWAEAHTAGALFGTKTILNELLAYLQMAQLPPEALSERSRLILTYALCGFANFGSLGIMLGGLLAMAPERRAELIELGLRSIIAGTLATSMTGAIVGLVG